jgi:hypothetical protein
MQNFSETSRGWIFGLAGAVFVAAALKISLLVADVVPFNADEAIIALMAKHILHGERPIFFYGQAYMGSLDAYLVALVFKLFGIHVWGVRLVQVAWFLAVPNISTTLYTTVSLGGYGEMLLIGNLIFLITLRVVRDISSEQDKVSIIPWFGLGLLSGFGLWVFGLTLVYTIPAFTYLAWYWIRSKQSDLLGNKSLSWRKLLAIRIEGDEYSAPVTQSRLWSVAFLGLALGAIPWWVYAQQAGLSKLLFELGGGAISGVE